MKTYLLILTVMTQFIAVSLFGQCERKRYCNDLMEDYDYRSQSSYAKLTPGDTSSVNIVLYSGQEYRIFVCSDPELKDVTWKVVQPERKTKRTIQKIKKDTIFIYKTDEYGNFVADNNGTLIVKEKHPTIDTIWNTERITMDRLLFDIKQSDKQPYYEIRPDKSARYIIRINVPAGDRSYSGCVNVYVGRRNLTSKVFIKRNSTSEREH